LNKTARNFAGSYMLVDTDGNDYVTRYWRSIFSALLQSLIAAPDPIANQIQVFLNKTKGFPLGRGNQEISDGDLQGLRLLLQTVVLPDTSATKGTAGDPIANGGRLVGDSPLIDPINKQLSALAKGSLSDKDRETIRQLIAFVAL